MNSESAKQSTEFTSNYEEAKEPPHASSLYEEEKEEPHEGQEIYGLSLDNWLKEHDPQKAKHKTHRSEFILLDNLEECYPDIKSTKEIEQIENDTGESYFQRDKRSVEQDLMFLETLKNESDNEHSSMVESMLESVHSDYVLEKLFNRFKRKLEESPDGTNLHDDAKILISMIEKMLLYEMYQACLLFDHHRNADDGSYFNVDKPMYRFSKDHVKKIIVDLAIMMNTENNILRSVMLYTSPKILYLYLPYIIANHKECKEMLQNYVIPQIYRCLVERMNDKEKIHSGIEMLNSKQKREKDALSYFPAANKVFDEATQEIMERKIDNPYQSEEAELAAQCMMPNGKNFHSNSKLINKMYKMSYGYMRSHFKFNSTAIKKLRNILHNMYEKYSGEIFATSQRIRNSEESKKLREWIDDISNDQSRDVVDAYHAFNRAFKVSDSDFE